MMGGLMYLITVRECHAGVDVSVRATSVIVLGTLGRG
jgi:hypothetical protein